MDNTQEVGVELDGLQGWRKPEGVELKAVQGMLFSGAKGGKNIEVIGSIGTFLAGLGCWIGALDLCRHYQLFFCDGDIKGMLIYVGTIIGGVLGGCFFAKWAWECGLIGKIESIFLQ